VIGPYSAPKVRLPGGGGAPEIASNSREVFITMAMSPRTFVERLPFVTSFGHGKGKGSREALGLTTQGPTKVVTDLCVLEPDPDTRELIVVSLHPGVTQEVVQTQCGWPLKFSSELMQTPAPTNVELATLRALQERTRLAHGP
jgi:glutaconate CoA-transferase subunit B